MPYIQIRSLSEEAYHRLKTRAKQDRRSIQQEATWLLETSLTFPDLFHAPSWKSVDRVQEDLRKRYGTLPDSTSLIREMRDQR